MMIQCQACKKEVAKDAQTCPHCGAVGPGQKATNNIVLGCLVVGFLLALAIGFFVCS